MSIIDPEWLARHPGAKTGVGPRVDRKQKFKGYADIPGTGPKGETCGTCAHHVIKRMAGTYHKCYLCANIWTGGGATDIKVRAAACSFWKKLEGSPYTFTPPH
jgi:ribosomal protein L37AE/L43A